MLAQESCDVWMISQSFLLKTSTHTIHPIHFQKCISLFPKELVEMRYSITKKDKNCQDHNRNFQAGVHHFPGSPNDTRWIVLPETKLHFVDSLLLNDLRYEAVAFGKLHFVNSFLLNYLKCKANAFGRTSSF